MRTQASRFQSEQARHLSENLMAQLARGREWATPGVHTALERAVAGLDSGIESASPRIQATVRRLAEELAGGVETVTPRIHEGLQRVAPNAIPLALAPEQAGRGRKAWVVAGVLAIAVSLGVAAWRIVRAPEEIAARVDVPVAAGVNPDDDPANAGVRI